MTYEKWNSYEATVRSRFLTADDLSLARLWARLELIIPYRSNRARKFGLKEMIKTQIKLLPHRAALVWARAAVAARRRRGSPEVVVPSEVAHRPITKTPLHWESRSR
jgi:hypothetical protein